MKVYLIQHGLAMSKDDDPDRPLTNEGRDETVKVANFIAQSGIIQIRNIFHSGKTRARQTAEIFGERTAPTAAVQQAEGLKAKDDPGIWGGKLEGAKEDVMLVGHLPHMAALANRLLCRDAPENIIEFENSGVVCLEKNKTWRIRWMIVPRLI
jgi:phosphohistidine phosphatase